MNNIMRMFVLLFGCLVWMGFAFSQTRDLQSKTWTFDDILIEGEIKQPAMQFYLEESERLKARVRKGQYRLFDRDVEDRESDLLKIPSIFDISDFD